jgi:hypothetical protein
MKERILMIWRDPVWSKVIAAAIIASGAIIWGTRQNWGAEFLKLLVPLWFVIAIAALSFLASVVSLSKVWRKTKQFEPRVELIDVNIEQAPVGSTLSYPLKCYVQFRNESEGAIDVSLAGYKPNKVTLKRLPLRVLQVAFKGWVPESEPSERIAAFAGQAFRLWLGVDETKFNAVRVDDLRGQIGTVTLKVNSKKVPFDL